MKQEHRWFYKQAVSFYLDAGRALPRRVRREVERDEECREYYRDQLAVVREIERHAEEVDALTPQALPSEILERLDNEVPLRTEASLPVWRQLLGSIHPLAGAAALIFLLVGVGPFLNDSAPVGAHSKVASLDGGSLEDWPALGHLSRWAMTLQNPLEEEMSATLSSATRAIETFREEYFPDSVLNTFGAAANTIRAMEGSRNGEP